MLDRVVEYLRCPKCHGVSLEVAPSEDAAESIVCKDCHKQYRVWSGIPEMFNVLDEHTAQEREARASAEHEPNVERARPYISDAQKPWLWPTFAANVEQGLEMLGNVKGPVVEVGAATCWATRMIAERGYQAMALDVSSRLLESGALQFSEHVQFGRVAGDMQNLPFRSQSLGGVFASATLHHTDALDQVFMEIARVLAPGGRLVMVNEPVLGILRSGDDFGEDDIAAGMNEHVYRLWQYQQAAAAANLKLQVKVPRSLALQSRRAIPSPSPLHQRGADLMGYLPSLLWPKVLWAGHLLIGLSLVAVAEKR